MRNALRTLPLTALILAPAAAFAGDIFNGPVLSGDAIPVNVDREVTYRALTLAIEKCTGDAAVEVARQIFPSRDPATLAAETLAASFPQGEYSFRDVDGLKLPVLDTAVKIAGTNQIVLAVYQNTQDLNLRGGPEVDGYLVVTPDALSSQPSKRSARAPWPQLAFTEVVRSDGFDPFGAPINPYRVARDIRIVKPVASGTAVAFENIASGNPAAFTVNSERYVNCLLTEIAR